MMDGAPTHIDFPNFAPPLEGQSLSYENWGNDTSLRDALWQLFWQLPIEKQKQAFTDRPLMGLYMQTLKDSSMDVLRDYRRGWEVVPTSLEFRVPPGFKESCSDPYMTLKQWRNFGSGQTEFSSKSPGSVYHLRVGVLDEYVPKRMMMKLKRQMSLSQNRASPQMKQFPNNRRKRSASMRSVVSPEIHGRSRTLREFADVGLGSDAEQRTGESVPDTGGDGAPRGNVEVTKVVTEVTTTTTTSSAGAAGGQQGAEGGTNWADEMPSEAILAAEGAPYAQPSPQKQPSVRPKSVKKSLTNFDSDKQPKQKLHDWKSGNATGAGQSETGGTAATGEQVPAAGGSAGNSNANQLPPPKAEETAAHEEPSPAKNGRNKSKNRNQGNRSQSRSPKGNGGSSPQQANKRGGPNRGNHQGGPQRGNNRGGNLQSVYGHGNLQFQTTGQLHGAYSQDPRMHDEVGRFGGPGDLPRYQHNRQGYNGGYKHNRQGYNGGYSPNRGGHNRGGYGHYPPDITIGQRGVRGNFGGRGGRGGGGNRRGGQQGYNNQKRGRQPSSDTSPEKQPPANQPKQQQATKEEPPKSPAQSKQPPPAPTKQKGEVKGGKWSEGRGGRGLFPVERQREGDGDMKPDFAPDAAPPPDLMSQDPPQLRSLGDEQNSMTGGGTPDPGAKFQRSKFPPQECAEITKPSKEKMICNNNYFYIDYHKESTHMKKHFSEGVLRPTEPLKVSKRENAIETLTMEDHYENAFTAHSLIGAGSFGEVYLAREKLSGVDYVLKRIKPRGSFDVRCCLNEVYACSALNDCPYIARFHRAWTQPGSGAREEFFLQHEFCNAGTLERAIEDNTEMGAKFTNTEYKQVLFHIGKALKYLHALGVGHFDLKPGNILATVSPLNAIVDLRITGLYPNSKEVNKVAPFDADECISMGLPIFKLCDLGLVNDGVSADRCESLGDGRYLAPERFDKVGANCFTDMFALGMTLLEMASVPRKLQHDKMRLEVAGNIEKKYNNQFLNLATSGPYQQEQEDIKELKELNIVVGNLLCALYYYRWNAATLVHMLDPKLKGNGPTNVALNSVQQPEWEEEEFLRYKTSFEGVTKLLPSDSDTGASEQNSIGAPGPSRPSAGKGAAARGRSLFPSNDSYGAGSGLDSSGGGFDQIRGSQSSGQNSLGAQGPSRQPPGRGRGQPPGSFSSGSEAQAGVTGSTSSGGFQPFTEQQIQGTSSPNDQQAADGQFNYSGNDEVFQRPVANGGQHQNNGSQMMANSFGSGSQMGSQNNSQMMRNSLGSGSQMGSQNNSQMMRNSLGSGSQMGSQNNSQMMENSFGSGSGQGNVSNGGQSN